MATAIGFISPSSWLTAIAALAIFIAIVLIPLFITRNVALSMALGLIALPFIVWFGTHYAFAAIMAAVLFIISFIKFLPTGLAALKKHRRKRDFVFDTFKGKDKEKK